MKPPVEVEQFLKKTQLAVLSTVDRQGRPHAMPMWCLYENGEFIMSTGPRSQKHNNIKHNDNVTLVFDKRELPYYAVMVRGSARIEITSSDAVTRKLAEAYLGKAGSEKYMRGRSAGESAVIRVKPLKFIEYHGVSGRY